MGKCSPDVGWCKIKIPMDGFDGVDPQLCFKSFCVVYGRQTLQAYVFLWEN